jgi:hypothetical protein
LAGSHGRLGGLVVEVLVKNGFCDACLLPRPERHIFGEYIEEVVGNVEKNFLNFPFN